MKSGPVEGQDVRNVFWNTQLEPLVVSAYATTTSDQQFTRYPSHSKVILPFTPLDQIPEKGARYPQRAFTYSLGAGTLSTGGGSNVGPLSSVSVPSTIRFTS